MHKVFFRLIALLPFIISLPQKIQAAPFSNPCGETNATRPACVPISVDDYNPNAFSQIPIDKDCSNYCFGSSNKEDYAFTSNPILNLTTVSCADPLIAKFSVLNEIWDTPGPYRPEIDAKYDYSVSGITSLSLGNTDRETAPTWWRMLNELGTAFSNNRGRPEEVFTQLDYGMNERTLSNEAQLYNRMEFCNNIIACSVDSHFDTGDARIKRTSQGLPLFSCVNSQPYNAYPEDFSKKDIVEEIDICQQAQSELAPYIEGNNLSSYFIPCTEGQNNNRCNQAYDATFARRFLAINPTYKSRNLMVVCSDKKYENVSSVANMFLKSKQTFDCQEMVISPGLIAACQGIWQQYQAWTPFRTSSQTYAEMEIEFKELADPNLADGIVKYKTSWFGNPRIDQIDPTKPEHRNLLYAMRINAENPTELKCDEDNLRDSETFGDRNLEIETSDPNSMQTDTRITNPQSSGSYVLQSTYVIAPAGFKQCFDMLTYTNDNSLTKQQIAYKERADTEIAKRTQMMQHETSNKKFDQSFGQICKNIPQPTTAANPVVTYKEVCEETHNLEIDSKREVRAVQTQGGTVASEYFLSFLKQNTTSFLSRDYAGKWKCDWYNYVRHIFKGTPISQKCKSTLFTGIQPGAGDLCSTGSQMCAVNRLVPYFGNIENATIASRACSRESGSYAGALNKSCLTGGRDFSVGLFQINLHPKAGRCEAIGLNPWQKNSDPNDWTCRVKNKSDLIKCINYYGGNPQNFDPSAPAPEKDYYIKNITWAARRACGSQLPSGTNCDWSPWNTNVGCQIR
jgi:hypothetical protein